MEKKFSKQTFVHLFRMAIFSFNNLHIEKYSSFALGLGKNSN